MADIALLVAEDFERRIKGSGRAEALKGEERFHFLAAFAASDVGRKARDRAAASVKLNVKEAAAAMEAVERALQPRSSVGVAAFDGLFSA